MRRDIDEFFAGRVEGAGAVLVEGFKEAGFGGVGRAYDTARRMRETVGVELAAEVGEIYADAVGRCLGG